MPKFLLGESCEYSLLVEAADEEAAKTQSRRGPPLGLGDGLEWR
jgi:hypothetical protein